LSDARDLSWIANESVHVVVTSPPYWTLKKYEANVIAACLGILEDFSFVVADRHNIPTHPVKREQPGRHDLLVR
jgi:site-specific DNA-methyltransferase (adenine-specific)